MKTISDYTIHCTPVQTKKALKLGAPITFASITDIRFERYVSVDNEEYAIPTAEQMIGWLRSKNIKFHFDDDTNYWHVSIDSEPLSIGYGTDKNKELAAIDAALEYLTDNNLIK